MTVVNKYFFLGKESATASWSNPISCVSSETNFFEFLSGLLCGFFVSILHPPLPFYFFILLLMRFFGSGLLLILGYSVFFWPNIFKWIIEGLGEWNMEFSATLFTQKNVSLCCPLDVTIMKMTGPIVVTQLFLAIYNQSFASDSS